MRVTGSEQAVGARRRLATGRRVLRPRCESASNPRAFPHQAFALAVGPLGVLFGNRRHARHAAIPSSPRSHPRNPRLGNSVSSRSVFAGRCSRETATLEGWAAYHTSSTRGTALPNRPYTGVPFRLPRNTGPQCSSRVIPCSNCARQRHKIIRNGVALVGKESVEWVTSGNRPRDKSGEPTHAHLRDWQ